MNPESNISVYILCGGLSTRMQEEKGLVQFNGKAFIECVIEAVVPIIQNIFLVTKNETYKQFGYPLVADVYENKGPVGGIYSALEHSKNEYNLILSCDIPNINTSVLQTYLLGRSNNNAITYLVDDEREYPLIGVYSKSVASLFKEAIISNKLKLIDLIKTTDYNMIQVESKDKNAIKNINTKEELITLSQLK